MDERVIRHYKGALDKININTDARDSLMKQYAQLAADIAATTVDAVTAPEPGKGHSLIRHPRRKARPRGGFFICSPKKKVHRGIPGKAALIFRKK